MGEYKNKSFSCNRWVAKYNTISCDNNLIKIARRIYKGKKFRERSAIKDA